jgi:hypothetical protein
MSSLIMLAFLILSVVRYFNGVFHGDDSITLTTKALIMYMMAAASLI